LACIRKGVRGPRQGAPSATTNRAAAMIGRGTAGPRLRSLPAFFGAGTLRPPRRRAALTFTLEST
jgi:hypothetical protein